MHANKSENIDESAASLIGAVPNVSVGALVVHMMCWPIQAA